MKTSKLVYLLLICALCAPSFALVEGRRSAVDFIPGWQHIDGREKLAIQHKAMREARQKMFAEIAHLPYDSELSVANFLQSHKQLPQMLKEYLQSLNHHRYKISFLDAGVCEVELSLPLDEIIGVLGQLRRWALRDNAQWQRSRWRYKRFDAMRSMNDFKHLRTYGHAILGVSI